MRGHGQIGSAWTGRRVNLPKILDNKKKQGVSDPVDNSVALRPVAGPSQAQNDVVDMHLETSKAHKRREEIQ